MVLLQALESLQELSSLLTNLSKYSKGVRKHILILKSYVRRPPLVNGHSHFEGEQPLLT